MEKSVTIKPSGGGHNTYAVHYGDTYADELTFDEMLGLVASITMPSKRGCLSWLKTAEQHKAWEDRVAGIKARATE